MKIFQMPRFKKHVKKLPRHFQQVILDAVEDISWQILTPVNLKKATWQVLVFISLRWAAN